MFNLRANHFGENSRLLKLIWDKQSSRILLVKLHIFDDKEHRKYLFYKLKKKDLKFYFKRVQKALSRPKKRQKRNWTTYVAEAQTEWQRSDADRRRMCPRFFCFFLSCCLLQIKFSPLLCVITLVIFHKVWKNDVASVIRVLSQGGAGFLWSWRSGRHLWSINF